MNKLPTQETLSLRKVVPYINWTYFFSAWKLSGKYDGIETLCDCNSCTALWLRQFQESERSKAEEALKLLRDAQYTLRKAEHDNTITIKAIHNFYAAHSVNNGIEITLTDKTCFIPTLRQQHINEAGNCLSLCDYVSPEKDEIGLFAVSVTNTITSDSDLYKEMLCQTLCDRLVEAASEYLHHKLLKGKGIRPAVGYPSLPDQSLLFDIDKILDLSKIGISVTENGAMLPLSSECGMYIKYPKAKYFMIGDISDEQLQLYAQERKKTPAEMRKWLTRII